VCVCVCVCVCVVIIFASIHVIAVTLMGVVLRDGL